MRKFAHAMHSMAAAALVLAAALLPLSSASAQNPPGLDGIDHHKVYRFGVPGVSSTVTLIDEWGANSHNVSGPRFFSPPVSKNNEGIFDPLAHYSWYDINSMSFSEPRTVTYKNQFGSFDLTTHDARFLVVPALKNAPEGMPLPNKNHYKCYDANGPGPFVTATLQTQFGLETVQVLHAALWCNPTDKDHMGQFFPMRNPAAHLVCYELTLTDQLGIGISIQDQMWPFPRAGQVMDNRWLCVPSVLDTPTPAESRTWSRVKAQYRD